ncbi:methyl-accepting chemotaxis protein [Ideonella sp. A 288]|uniref:methyl-accepting chemotaxis protein n=1 Tax=Ideonella sp. A 288 TaxID=1962181 RepID=UPI000B4BA25C|nr:methyl-accepting chemotaxis protein [Ideonella sp. A 288]
MFPVKFSPLGPGIALMRRLRMSAKMALMVAVLLVPLGVLLASTYLSVSGDAAQTQRELRGAQQVNHLLGLVIQTQNHRDIAHRALSGDEAAAAQRATAATGLRQAIATADPPGGTPASGDDWPALRQALTDLAEGRGPGQRTELFALHADLVERLRWRVRRVAEDSGLLLDPQADTYFLMDLVVERAVPWLESLALMGGQGAALLARGDASGAERAGVIGHADRVQGQLLEIDRELAALQRAGANPPAGWAAAREASARAAVQGRAVFSAEAIVGEPAPFHQQAAQALAAAQLTQTQLVGQLVDRLGQRLQAQRRSLWLHLAVVAVGLGLVAYLGLAFYVSFAGALRTLMRGVQEVADGDLSHRIEIRGRDELVDIGTQVERMNEQLSALVAQIRSSAVRVGMSGEKVSLSSQSLAIRTDEQSNHLRQTVTTVHHLSEAVAANAGQAGELDQLTTRLRAEAEAGGLAMRQSMEAMSGLEAGSRRVGEIIGVIDGIAFQTNILALNAAVEAARAGEAGRGFAVVATEVRQLAQRSSQASSEIRKLIAQSSDQVKVSVERTNHVAQALDALVDGVRKVSGSLQSIAAASAEQSAGLMQVSKAVGNLDELTHRNVTMVEESSVAAADLVERASALSGAVASIRLRQGSADEARALARRALEQIKAVGLHAAMHDLHSRESGYVDRDLYVFMVDRRGTYLLHGVRPEMEGRRIHDVPGIDGDRFIREAWAAGESHDRHGGWVEYDIVNPESGDVQPKSSFVVPLSDTQLIGCGVYRQDVLLGRSTARV